MKKTSATINFLRLIRPPTAGSTGVIVIIGYLIMMGSYDSLRLFILFIIGIFSHIFIFVLNEYFDIKVDKKSHFLKNKPLVSGAISKKHALIIALISCTLSYIFTIIFFFSLYPILFLSLALILGIIYDIWGKIIPGSDVFIAGASFFGCLFGASIVSIKFTNLVYIISLLVFIFLIFCSAIIGGLKDVDHDALAGAKTTATRLGAKVVNGNLYITKKFKVFAYGLDLIFIILIFLVIIQMDIDIWSSYQYIIFAIVLLTILTFISLFKILKNTKFERPRLLRLFGLNTTATYLLVPIVLFPIIGFILMLILLILPTAWGVIWNVILYSKPLQPQA